MLIDFRTVFRVTRKLTTSSHHQRQQQSPLLLSHLYLIEHLSELKVSLGLPPALDLVHPIPRVVHIIAQQQVALAVDEKLGVDYDEHLEQLVVEDAGKVVLAELIDAGHFFAEVECGLHVLGQRLDKAIPDELEGAVVELELRFGVVATVFFALDFQPLQAFLQPLLFGNKFINTMCSRTLCPFTGV